MIALTNHAWSDRATFEVLADHLLEQGLVDVSDFSVPDEIPTARLDRGAYNLECVVREYFLVHAQCRAGAFALRVTGRWPHVDFVVYRVTNRSNNAITDTLSERIDLAGVHYQPRLLRATPLERLSRGLRHRPLPTVGLSP